MLAWLHTRPDDWLRAALTPWDNQFYVQIAEHGYPHALSYDEHGALAGSPLAFFPLYPAVIAVVAGVTGADGADASVVAAWLASAAAAVVVHRLGLRLYGPRAALALVVLVFTQPMAVTLWIGYSESLFLLLAAGCLLAAHREAWLTAGALALLAGLTRSTGAAVAVALAVAAVAATRRRRRVEWRAVAGPVVGALGVPGYLAWVGWRTGRPDAWFAIQRAGWQTAWDWGAATWRFLADTLRRGHDWVPMVTAVLLVALAAAVVTALLRGTWPPLAVYGVLILVLTVGQTNYYHSKPRLLVPALLTLVPVAAACARPPWRTKVPALVALALFGTWFGAYMLTDWIYAI
nr:mannosyltransferase family protein [Streptomyces sp. SID5468]